MENEELEKGEESDIFPHCTRTVTRGVTRKRSDPWSLQLSVGLLFPALPLTPNFLPSVNTTFARSRHVNSAEVQLQGQETRNDPRLCFRKGVYSLPPPGGESTRHQERSSVLITARCTGADVTEFVFLGQQFFLCVSGGIFRKNSEDGNEAGHHKGPI